MSVLMHWYNCKSLLNTLGRAVEQLADQAECLANKQKLVPEAKVQQHAIRAQRVKLFMNI